MSRVTWSDIGFGVAFWLILMTSTFVLAYMFVPVSSAQDEVIPEYNRTAQYGRWADYDSDCKNTRAELLEALSNKPVTYSHTGCTVKTGAWTDAYTGEIITDASDIDIDHIVAVQAAHYAGGYAWEKLLKHTFYNDRDNLLLTRSSINRSKGAKNPGEWEPKADPYWFCDFYVERWKAVVKKYKLGLDVSAEVCNYE